MRAKKIYQLDEYNDLVLSKAITEDFDYSNKMHTCQVYYPRKLDMIELKVVFVTVPISCPHCQAKLWDAFFDHPGVLKNLQNYINSPWHLVVCLVCGFSSTRAVPDGKKL